MHFFLIFCVFTVKRNCSDSARSGLWKCLWHTVHRLHGWNIRTLWQQKKISGWPKSGQVKTGSTWPSATFLWL